MESWGYVVHHGGDGDSALALDRNPSRSFLHGPVASGVCLDCHHAHSSIYPVLLRKRSPALCLNCHVLASQGAPSTPAHEDLGRDCLECHHGHGSEQQYLLRRRVDPDT